jgi:hypothetical protein
MNPSCLLGLSHPGHDETGDGHGARGMRYRQRHEGHETTHEQAKRSVLSAHGYPPVAQQASPVHEGISLREVTSTRTPRPAASPHVAGARVSVGRARVVIPNCDASNTCSYSAQVADGGGQVAWRRPCRGVRLAEPLRMSPRPSPCEHSLRCRTGMGAVVQLVCSVRSTVLCTSRYVPTAANRESTDRLVGVRSMHEHNERHRAAR